VDRIVRPLSAAALARLDDDLVRATVIFDGAAVDT
jgi:hypothetical protein